MHVSHLHNYSRPKVLFYWRRRKGLVHTDCLCAHLHPESGYCVYSYKILSKIQIYNYVSFHIILAIGQQQHTTINFLLSMNGSQASDIKDA